MVETWDGKRDGYGGNWEVVDGQKQWVPFLFSDDPEKVAEGEQQREISNLYGQKAVASFHDRDISEIQAKIDELTSR